MNKSSRLSTLPLWALVGSLSTLAILPAQAALTWPGCDPIKASEFKMVRLIGKSNTNSPLVVDATMEEPIKLAFDMDASGNVDVYWVERLGGVKRYSHATKTVSLVGKLTPGTENEDGLVGIVLDPAFKTNKWMYLYYSYGTDFRVSRFTLVNGTLDKTSEKIILAIPSDRNKDHSGGPMAFDDYGDLWISVGDNLGGQRSSGNSNDLRGGILRIRPTADGKYTVPAGNWKETLTDNYSAADLAKIRPEIYVKGTRNAYTIYVDPVRRWLAWGDVGPDWYTSAETDFPTEEHNLVKQPGFMGWPFFAGPNLCNGACTADKNGPAVTISGNTGVSKLPPAIPPISPYPRSAAMTGPIYRYDGDNPSKIKLPPHFDRKWLLSDFRSRFVAATLNTEGTQITAKDTVWANLSSYGGTNSNSLVDLQQGPDGAIYVINYNGWYTTASSTNIARFEYTGSCLPMEPKLETLPASSVRLSRPTELPGVKISGQGIRLIGDGDFQIRLFDMAGKEIYFHAGKGSAFVQLPDLVKRNPSLLEVTTAKGIMQRSIFLP